MPVISRKRKRDEQDQEPQSKRAKTRKAFEEYSSLGYKEDSCHSIFIKTPSHLEGLQDVVSKELVSLLNTNGGIMCFGARPTGIVYGQRISRKEEDIFKCTIDEVVKRIHPMVKPGMYRMSFTPVVNQRGRDVNRHVLEIRVQRGDPFQMYETGGSDPKIGRKKESQVYLRSGHNVSGPLTPHQIKDHTIQLLKEKLQYEADLAEKLKTPSVSTSTAPLSVEITKVVAGNDKSQRSPLKAINSDKSKKEEREKSPIIFISSDESDECPFPDTDLKPKNTEPTSGQDVKSKTRDSASDPDVKSKTRDSALGLDVKSKTRDSASGPDVKSKTTDRSTASGWEVESKQDAPKQPHQSNRKITNKISSLVKSFKKSVKDKFGSKSTNMPSTDSQIVKKITPPVNTKHVPVNKPANPSNGQNPSGYSKKPSQFSARPLVQPKKQPYNRQVTQENAPYSEPWYVQNPPVPYSGRVVSYRPSASHQSNASSSYSYYPTTNAGPYQSSNDYYQHTTQQWEGNHTQRGRYGEVPVAQDQWYNTQNYDDNFWYSTRQY